MSPVQRPKDHTEDLSSARRRHAELEREYGSAATPKNEDIDIAPSQYRLLRGRKEQSYGDPEHPSDRTLRMLDKVVGTDLKAHRLRPQVERLANIHAHGNSPRVSRIGRLVEGHSGVGINVPSALAVVADPWLEVGEADAAAPSIASEGHYYRW